MNKINRPLVKSQARQIIKGKVFLLFIISFLVSVLAGGATYVYNFSSNYDNLMDDYNHYSDDNFDNYYDDYFDQFDFNDDDNYTDENPIDDFGYDANSTDAGVNAVPVSNGAVRNVRASALPFVAGLGGISTIIMIIFTPLTVTLAGLYVSLIRKNANEKFDLGKELGGIFKNTFNETYGKKLVGAILVEILICLLCILFIVPGIIFNYSAYFTFQIMCDHPNLKPSEAIKLSKKMIKGNRTELFTYDLSFIPWYLLCAITLGIANIYVIPYKSTADALYYENFRLRALAEGRITEDDFLSEQERIMKYNSTGCENGYQQQTYYTPNTDNEQNMGNMGYQPYQAPAQNVMNNNGTFYTPDFSPVEQFNPYVNPVQPNQPQNNGYYNAPTEPQQQSYYQPTSAEQPQQQYYQPPVEQPEEQPSAPSYYNPPQETESNNAPEDTDNEQ